MNKTIKIEIIFPVMVDFPDRFQQELDFLIGKVCKKYEADNPGRVMWPFANGAKPIWNEPNEPEWNESIYEIQVAEREK